MSEHDQIHLNPVTTHPSLRKLAYDALKAAILDLDVYGITGDLRLDERNLSRDLGISRTPVREAITILEHEGWVKSKARHGIFIVRKSKQQMTGIILTCTALESMAARLACARASDGELESLRRLFPEFYGEASRAKNHEYSDANLRFHQKIIALGRCETISSLSANLFMHMRGIRRAVLKTGARTGQSIMEHVKIIEALEVRDAERAGCLVRDHGLGLADHVGTHFG